MGWLAELGRRNVLRVGAAYLALSWLLLQVTATVAPIFDLPGWTQKLAIWLLALGLLPTLLLAWMFEWTPDGPVRDRGATDTGKRTRRKCDAAAPTANGAVPDTSRWQRIHRIDLAIIGVLSLMLAWHWFRTPEATESREEADSIAAEPASPAEQTRAIAVLPFASMSEDPADGYFADGLTEEILNRLVGTKGLRVINRTSSFAYRDRAADLREIARALGVDVLLQGSVRRAGNQLRITAQLAQGSDGIQLWSRTYNHRLDDIFAVQDTVAADVARELSVNLSPADSGNTIATRDPRAMALYLQAKAAREAGSDEDAALSLSWILQAIQLDPGFAEAHALLALIEIDQVFQGVIARDRAISRARKAIDRALDLAPDSAVVLAAAGRVLIWEADLGGGLALRDEAHRLVERALIQRPDDVDILLRHGWLLMTRGEYRGAADVADRIIQHEPIAELHRGFLIEILLYSDRLEAAREHLLRLPAGSWRRATLSALTAPQGSPIEQLHGRWVECIRLGRSGCFVGLAVLFFMLGDDENAAKALEAVPESDAAAREVSRVWAMQMRGEWQLARDYTLQRYPEMLDAPYDVLDNLGDQAVALGDWAEALRIWRRIEPDLLVDPPRTDMFDNNAINVAHTLAQIEDEARADRIWQMLDAHFDVEPSFVRDGRRTRSAVIAAHALGFREKARDRLQAAITSGFREERLFEYTEDRTPFPAGEAARNDPLIAPLLAALRERNRADLKRLHTYLAEHDLPAVPVWKDPEPQAAEDAQQVPR